MRIAQILLFVLIAFFSSPFPANAEDSEARARRLMNALGCKACHSFEQSGSDLAPPLDRVGERYTLEQLKAKLSLHRNQSTMTAMPSYATTPDEDLIDILQFLAARK